MLSPWEVEELLTQARRNEDIQRRLDLVEEFLLSYHILAETGLPTGIFTRPRNELCLILGNIEQPFLTNRVSPELGKCFFPGDIFVAYLAVIPMWARDQFLGTLNLSSDSYSHYQPLLDTHFLRRLGNKTAAGLEACLLREQTRLMEATRGRRGDGRRRLPRASPAPDHHDPIAEDAFARHARGQPPVGQPDL